MFRHLDLAFWRAQNHLGSQPSSFTRKKQVQPLGRIAELRNAILAFYTRIHEEHWLRDKLEEGRIVILEDESIWEVHPWDRRVLPVRTAIPFETAKGV